VQPLTLPRVKKLRREVGRRGASHTFKSKHGTASENVSRSSRDWPLQTRLDNRR